MGRLLPFFALFTGCGTSLSVAAKQATVVEDRAAGDGCRSLGDVEGSSALAGTATK
jgi:hypothetical protein